MTDHRALNPELKEALYELITVPEDFGTVTFRVTQDLIDDTTYALGDHAAWYYRDSPFGGPIAPPMTLANDLLFMFYRGYDGNTAQGLHTHAFLRFSSPVRPGEEVTVGGAYVEKYVKRGHGFVTLEATATGIDGRELIYYIGKEIMRTVPGDVAGKGTSDATERTRTVIGVADPALPVAEHAHADLPPGSPLPTLTTHFSQNQLVVFSWGGYGFMNVHTSRKRAADAGLDRTIVQAFQQSGVLVQLMVGFFGPSWFNGGELDLKYTHPLFVDETFSVSGRVLGVTTDGRLECEVWADKATGERTLLGWASAPLEGAGPGPEQML
ncbi:hypothetical protein [Microbacterium sp. CJ77]|uniref:hypothetical protein n=1 Tax=Microbacterium sp. CJ77 TaxID=2079201 RepID=UPI000CD9A9F5|nr:hypothetical protein [Microbacterium sp. CJ77]